MSTDNPLLSVIIISYNTRELTLNCIKSLAASVDGKIPYEIIVIDNDSPDDSVDKLLYFANQNSHLKINIVENGNNVGFAKANNQGIAQAKGKYILLLNSDTVIEDSAVSGMLDYYRQNENRIHFLGPKLLNKDNTPQASCGPFYTIPVVFAALFLRGDYWGLTRNSPDKPASVDWVSGACILAKKEYLVKLGGFDEGIFMYMDEIDLLFRAKKVGYRTAYYPGARIIHYGSASSGKRTYPILQVYRGFIYFYRKHYGGVSLFWLKFLLKLKAAIALSIGRLTANRYLIETYEKALEIVKLG